MTSLIDRARGVNPSSELLLNPAGHRADVPVLKDAALHILAVRSPPNSEIPVSRETLDLFISYAREDEPLRRKLEEHLAALERAGEIRPWHEREIGTPQ